MVLGILCAPVRGSGSLAAVEASSSPNGPRGRTRRVEITSLGCLLTSPIRLSFSVLINCYISRDALLKPNALCLYFYFFMVAIFVIIVYY